MHAELNACMLNCMHVCEKLLGAYFWVHVYGAIGCKVCGCWVHLYGDCWVHVCGFWVHVYGAVGCMYAVVGCMYAVVGCIYAVCGCMYAVVGCKINGCWVHVC